MRLTVYTDYALRVLMYAAMHPDRLCTIAEIAKAYDISRNHLMKVVHELGVAGDIETVRGVKGGIRLAKPPEQIVLGQVIRRTEPEATIMPCIDSVNAYCSIAPACKLKRALHQATVAFFEVLDGYTLADLTANEAVLKELLSRPPTGALVSRRRRTLTTDEPAS